MFENNDSSDDNDESLSKQVLPTADDLNGPIDMNKMPTTGEEYLRQVRFQASRLPDFQKANERRKRPTQSSNLRNHAWHKLFSTTDSASQETTKHFVPIDWQNEQCRIFSEVRNDFFDMRDRIRAGNKKYKNTKLKSANHYWKFCFGDDIPFQSPLSSLETDEQQQIQNPFPTMTKMSILTQPQIHELLQHEIDWLKQCGCSVHLALYTYATLVAIEKPISEDEMFTIRQTCLAWKQIRMQLLNSTDNEHSVDTALIKSCDLFMKSLKYCFQPSIINRLPSYVAFASRRYLATEKSKETKVEASVEIGPSAPELQVTNLTGEHEHVIEVALNRGERRNALGKELLAQLDATMDSIKDNKKIRCVLFHSLVPNVFCAGADLKERINMPQEEVGPFVSKIKEIFSKVFGLPIPTIAALDGLALGGGLELALACDIRIAANTAKLGLTETKLGIIPGAGGTQRLPRLIGSAKAKELIYTGRVLDGQQAYDIRLVNEVVKQNEQLNAAYKRSLEIAREIAQQGPLAVRMAKQAINKGIEVDLQTGLDVEEGCYDTVLTSEDRIEGLKAFQEKRKPVYKGV
ncbi:hypothetical protein I4U23_002144 [Adineta vaga]|nr:hypothetical protein I4U23_002144 [Adineta vaga]